MDGNCQISTTLYNAILSVPSLVVTERHAHSNSVPYIAKGKDAAVAYGSYDLKFRNDSENFSLHRRYHRYYYSTCFKIKQLPRGTDLFGNQL